MRTWKGCHHGLGSLLGMAAVALLLGVRGTAEPQRDLPPLPAKLPAWIHNHDRNHIFMKRGRYNFDVYRRLGALARDLNGVSVGHAMAYEDLVTGKAAELESRTYQRIRRVLSKPPRFMPDEAALAPRFGRLYGNLEQVFDWTHVLHAQTIDVLVSTDLSPERKDREVERLWDFYFRNVPYAVTPLPLNMDYLYGQSYSQTFRRRYPKVNGLFWGYHWLQNAVYDLLYRTSLESQRKSYDIVGDRYHQVELNRSDRPFMPMFGELSPTFAGRFPHIANAFDNLHMLHDMVNDILASDWIPERQKGDQIKRAIWLVSAAAHQGERPGEFRGSEASSQSASGSDDRAHDHRFFEGMPGMGMMRGMQPELMWMESMGWMNMAECHHCSMPLWEGKEAWRNSSVSADGWSMRVRCVLCARDMATETKGRAILRLATENPEELLVVLSDEQGNLTTSQPGAVFLEAEASHAGCDGWSRAFTSREAFDRFVKGQPELAGATPLSFQQWAQREGKRPDTYTRRQGPTENPYAAPAPGIRP